MKTIPSYLIAHANAVDLALKVQPRARKNAILSPLGAELRVSLTAPPVDGVANEALVRFLADELHCARNQLQIIRGSASRHKKVRVTGLTVEHILRRLPPMG